MPGPGGGGHSGGGFGGHHGGGGRNHSSGSFYFWGPRTYRMGIVPALFSIFFGPLIMIAFAVFFLVILFLPTTTFLDGGEINFNEEEFENYANEQYYEIFDEKTAFEDNILLVLLTSEQEEGRAYIAWVGNHINLQINSAFDAEKGALGRSMERNLPQTNYSTALSSALSRVVNEMTESVLSLGVSPFEGGYSACEDTSHNTVSSALINRSVFEISSAPVDAALSAFTQETGITAVLLVANAEDVVGKDSSGKIIGVVFCSVFILIALSSIVAGLRSYKKYRALENKQNGGPYDPHGGNGGNGGNGSWFDPHGGNGGNGGNGGGSAPRGTLNGEPL